MIFLNIIIFCLHQVNPCTACPGSTLKSYGKLDWCFFALIWGPSSRILLASMFVLEIEMPIFFFHFLNLDSNLVMHVKLVVAGNINGEKTTFLVDSHLRQQMCPYG